MYIVTKAWNFALKQLRDYWSYEKRLVLCACQMWYNSARSAILLCLKSCPIFGRKYTRIIAREYVWNYTKWRQNISLYRGSYMSVHVFISSQSLNFGGRRGTTDGVATIPFHPSMSSAALGESPNPIPVHSLMLSSHLFFCLTFLLAPFTVPCRTVFAMPEDLEMWPYHLSCRFFTMVNRSFCT